MDGPIARQPATDAERLKRYKSGLAGLRRGRRFIDWSGSREFAAHLQDLLVDLASSGCDAKTGADLVGKFFECDEATLGRCDDSSGIVGDVFRMTARDLWVRFASRCEDRDWLLDRLFGVVSDDGYGVRDSLLHAAPEYLSEPEMRSLADRLWGRGQRDATRDGIRSSWYLLVGVLAEALGDAALHEKATVAWCGGKVGGLYLDIARVYLETGSATGALRWLETRDEDSRFREDEHDRLLLQAYEQMGAKSKQVDVARRIFDRDPTLSSLDQLTAVVGTDKRAGLIEDVAARARAGSLDLQVTVFLLDVGRGQDAADHIVACRDELSAYHYSGLLHLAERFQDQGLLLSAVCLYRALLESILARAVAKYYGHGVRYLRKLDALGPQVTDWGSVEPQESYRERLAEQHRLKRSFWKRMDGNR